LELQLELETYDFQDVAFTISNALHVFLQEKGINGLKIKCKQKIDQRAGEKLRRVERKY
jgi:hypothetical protein